MSVSKSFLQGDDPFSPQRSATQIVDKNGNGFDSFLTHNLWIGKHEEFTPPREGNSITPFTTGTEYFERLSKAIEGASSEIWIAGWQINWDVHLVPGKRLFDVLLTAAKTDGMQIYIMPWAGSSQVPTYAYETEQAIKLINDIVGKTVVHVKLAPEMADESSIFMSHHQKHVVIDRKIAFVGGIDLAYGRRDDAHYYLDLDKHGDGRASLECYNGCVAHIMAEDKSAVINPGLLNPVNTNPTAIDPFGKPYKQPTPLKDELLNKIQQQRYQQQSTSFKGMTLDPSRQPRMPWQDSHVEIEGPAALDIALNFAIRWNCVSVPGEPKLSLPPAASSVKGTGSCMVQVLRSASKKMVNKEYSTLTSAQRREYFEESVLADNKEDNIYQAMKNLIERSQYYIYIENQFFISAFGNEQEYKPKTNSGPKEAVESSNSFLANREPYLTHAVPGDALAQPSNNISHALGERIGKAILTEEHPDFHVTIVLPVHPEGMLSEPTIMSQVHQTMQTLVFGEFSLVNRIRRFLKVKELQKKDDPMADMAYFGDGYKDIDIKECDRYLTLLNLRNYAKVGKGENERYVTEQIYVHNKMMIVDDLYAIVGSANINERSMLGSRDSELAVLVMDTTTEKADIVGDGNPVYTRKFARELRKKVWSKIFGLTAGGDKAATDLEFAIHQPASKNAWQTIRAVAQKNTNSYEAVFNYIPRDRNPEDKETSASIWPTWKNGLAKKAVQMPFNDDFWKTPHYNSKAVARLEEIKGFITLLPMEWTKGENNKFDYHAALLSDKGRDQGTPPGMSNSASVEQAKADEPVVQKAG